MLDILRFYHPSQKDLLSGNANVRRFVETLSASAVAASVGANGSIGPTDTVRLITHVDFVWTPGAAQFGLWSTLQVVDPSTSTALCRASATPDTFTAAQVSLKTVSGLEMALMQGEQLVLSSAFNAGANSNTTACFIYGWEFPRGTLQR